MTCSALEFQGPEQILFKVTLEQWEQQVLSIPGWETPKGLVAASLELSSAKRDSWNQFTLWIALS